MAIFVQDLMTDANGTLLTAHTPTGPGDAWVLFSGPADVTIDNNRAHHVTAASSSYLYCSTPAPSSDYYVEALITRVSDSGSTPAVLGRFNEVSGDRYQARWERGPKEWILYKYSGAAFTNIGSWGEDWTSLDSRTLRLEMVGDQIKVYVDGTERIAVTDADVVDAGYSGIAFYGFSAGGAAIGEQIDSLLAFNLGGGSGYTLQAGTCYIIKPTNTGGPVTTYTALDGLPDGMALDPVTGWIQGTPTGND